VTKPDMQLHI